MPSNTTEPFAFDPELSPQANVAAFFEHLEQTDKELAGLLRDNLGDLLAAAERDRTTARRRFNRAIAEVLDAPPDAQGGESS